MTLRAAMIILAGLLATSLTFEARAVVLVPPSVQDADSMIHQAACKPGWQSSSRFVYAAKVKGRCPPGYNVPGGIGGSRCTKRVEQCIPRPNCGTRVC